MSRLVSFVRANAVLGRLHLGPCTQLTDLGLTSPEHVELTLPRASVDKTVSLAQTRPSALQKASRWRQRLMLSEESSISHFEIVSVHSAENHFLRVCGTEGTLSSAYYAPRTVLDVFIQVTSFNPPIHPVGEGDIMFILLMKKLWFGELKDMARTHTEECLRAHPSAHHTISWCLLMPWGREGCHR